MVMENGSLMGSRELQLTHRSFSQVSGTLNIYSSEILLCMNDLNSSVSMYGLKQRHQLLDYELLLIQKR